VQPTLQGANHRVRSIALSTILGWLLCVRLEDGALFSMCRRSMRPEFAGLTTKTPRGSHPPIAVPHAARSSRRSSKKEVLL
jgi:hypothetical protein